MKHRRTVVASAVSAVVAVALLAVGLVAMRDSAPADGGAGLVAARKQQPAPTSVTYLVRADGKLTVTVQGKFKAAEVKYTRNRSHLRTGKMKRGRTRVVLPRGAERVKARAKATGKRAASRWVKAVQGPTPAASRTPAPVGPPVTDPNPADWVGLTRADLQKVAGMKSYFGHQSVGGNILGAIPGVFADFDLTAPPVLEAPASVSGGGFLHNGIGANGNPQSKITDFAGKVRGGIGQKVDTAFMKFCYVDITAGSDVTSVFASYRDTMAALQREYPAVAFLYVTVPLTTNSPADNAARERFNALMRDRYGDSGRLFDLAAIESTRPDGTRVSGTHNGATYYALYSGYASDEGHLNTRGAKAAGSGLLDVIAHAGK